MDKVFQQPKKWILNNLVFISWIVALGAVIGSMGLSEILNLKPCALCWYQRIFMFPLAFVLGVGVYRKDDNSAYYALPLSIIGMVIAFYHTLLQWGIIKEVITTCSIDSSCAEPQINWFGFITIPFMSFLAFTTLTIILSVHIRLLRKSSNSKNIKTTGKTKSGIDK